MTAHSTELAALADRFRARLAEAIAAPPAPLNPAQRARLSRQARTVETAITALEWELNHSWKPVQDAFAAALARPVPRALLVNRAAYRRKTRHRNRRTR